MPFVVKRHIVPSRHIRRARVCQGLHLGAQGVTMGKGRGGSMALRDELLAELEARRGEDVSGQALAGRFGVSRSAVWKAIGALRAAGFAIDSTPNRGYRLRPEDDRLSVAGVRAALGGRCPGLDVRVYGMLDSTNAEAQRLLADGAPCPMLLLAEGQTAGRGRCGRTFYSPRWRGAVHDARAPAPRGALASGAAHRRRRSGGCTGNRGARRVHVPDQVGQRRLPGGQEALRHTHRGQRQL